jgi:hypothetical protein
MQTIEFDAPIKDGVVHIPKEYKLTSQQKIAHITIHYNYKPPSNENIVFANTSANSIKEWHNEDDIWK